MFHGKLLTNKNRIRKGCTLVSSCDHYGVVRETTSHLLFSSPFTADIWRWLENHLKCKLGISSPFNLLMMAKRIHNSQLTNIFIVVIINVMWFI